ncbi:MAG TPA: rhomboid family intramembrane serine protease [Nocardioidaceae bacterium]
MSTGTTPYCYRHPERETHIRCQRCDRPICPDCMTQAAVGFQCPDCVKEGSRTQRPVRTVFGGRRSGDPTLTSKVLIGINAAVFLLIVATGGRASEWLDRLALVSSGGLLQLQDGTVVRIYAVSDGAWWQLVTSMFTHYSFMHIGFNMLALWFLGPQLEAAVGRLRFLALYFLSGLMGSAFVYWLSPVYTPTVGASGAVFGIMGGLLVLAVKLRADYSQILVWLGLNLLITVFGRGLISWQGHLGGLVGGILVALVLAYSPRRHRGAWQAVGLGLIALAILVAVVARTLVLT